MLAMPVAPALAPCPITRFITVYLADLAVDRRPATVDEAGRALRRFSLFLGSRPLETLARPDARLFLLALRQTRLSAPTCNKTFRHVKAALAWAEEAGVIPRHPWRATRALRCDAPSVRTVSRLEISRLLGACRSPAQRALILLMADCGLRTREAVSLRAAWIDFPRLLIRLPAEACKSRRGRTVGLTRRAMAALREAGMMRRPRALLFPGRFNAGRPITQPYEGLRALWRRAGVVGVPYDLRRTAITRWLSVGTSPNACASLAGHRSPVTTLKHYAAAAGENDAREAANRLDQEENHE
ncbi:MAG: tyrosine-type recombinase/integrase [Planctomycetes bacterium]|nr:tyrosine-type recombinase/integrase [Planctomycetota bacterium]